MIDDDSRLVSTDEGAAILGVAPGTVRSWRSRDQVQPAGILPARGRGGIVPLYKLGDLRECLATRRERKSDQKRPT